MNLRKLRIQTLAAVLTLVLVLASGTASATTAAAKPGLLPGKWQGTGTISGSSSDGAMTTVFSGKLRFTLIVRRNLSVAGSGSRSLTMKGSGADTSSTMTGRAALKFSGSARDVRFAGNEQVTGHVTASGVTTPVSFPREIKGGRLAISRAGKCRASGTSRMGPGITLKWTARLAINGTCNA